MEAAFTVIAANFQTLATAFTSLLPTLTAASDNMAAAAQKQNDLVEEMQKGRNAEAVRKLKPDAPTEFEGNPDKVEGFLMELTFYFDAIGVTDKDARITFALSKVKKGTNDVAGSWANAMRTEIWRKRHLAEPEEYFESWNAFMDSFRRHFVLHNTAEEAAREIGRLEMGSKTCEEYTTIFNGYMAQLTNEYGAFNLMEDYKRGLNKQLRDKVFALDPIPTNVIGWQEKALVLDRQYRQSKAYDGGSSSRKKEEIKPKEAKREWVPRPYYQAPAATPRTPAPPAFKDPNAMDVDRMKKEGRCFRCQEKGHIGRDCPKKREYTTRKMAINEMTKEEHDALRAELAGFVEGQE